MTDGKALRVRSESLFLVQALLPPVGISRTLSAANPGPRGAIMPHDKRSDAERFDELLSVANRIARALEDMVNDAFTLNGPGPNEPPPEPPPTPPMPDG